MSTKNPSSPRSHMTRSQAAAYVKEYIPNAEFREDIEGGLSHVESYLPLWLCDDCKFPNLAAEPTCAICAALPISWDILEHSADGYSIVTRANVQAQREVWADHLYAHSNLPIQAAQELLCEAMQKGIRSIPGFSLLASTDEKEGE